MQAKHILLAMPRQLSHNKQANQEPKHQARHMMFNMMHKMYFVYVDEHKYLCLCKLAS